MRFSPFTKATLLLLIFLVACQAKTPTGVPSPTSTATVTPSPTSTPDPEIISPENASRLTLKWMNMGAAIGESIYSADGKWLYQESNVGIYAFDTASYHDVHLLETTPAELVTPGEQTFPELEPLPGFTNQPQVRRTVFSPDGSLIARDFTSTDPHPVAIWRAVDGKLISNRLEGWPIKFSADNRLITIGQPIPGEDYEYYIALYDLQTGERLGRWASWRAVFLSDNRLAVESDGYTRVFDPVTRKVPHAFPGEYAAFSPDEQIVAVVYGNRIHIYRVSDGKLLQNLDGGLTSTDEAFLSFSRNGQILAGYTKEYYCCAGWGARLSIWRVADGSLLVDLSRESDLYAYSPISLSPDGSAFLIGSRVHRISDGSLIADLGTYFIASINNLAFTPDGQQIVVVSGYKDLYLYPVDGTFLGAPQLADPETYNPMLRTAGSHPYPYPNDPVDVRSPDKKFLARRDKGIVTIFTWSGTGTLYPIPVYQVRRLAFSPDGRILTLGLLDGSVVLWDMNSRQFIYTLPPPTEDEPNPVGGLAFSLDGKLLAIGLEDGTVRLFEIDPQN